jgi:hypothetical protein
VADAAPVDDANAEVDAVPVDDANAEGDAAPAVDPNGASESASDEPATEIGIDEPTGVFIAPMGASGDRAR